MLYGYTKPDGTILSINYQQLYIKTEEGELLSRRLHDEEGKPILKPGEELLFIDKAEVDLFDQWRLYNVNEIFKRVGGHGFYYLTNRRVIILRQTTYNDPRLIPLLMDAWKKKEGLREFIELEFHDIIKIDPRTQDGYFLSNYQIGRCGIMPASLPHLIEMLKQREVKRELVGFGKNKAEIIYYIDPAEFKKEPLYDKHKNLIEKGVKLEEKGKKQKAIVIYKEALAVFPDDKLLKKKIDELETAHKNYLSIGSIK